MPVTASNLLQGPATLYIAPFGTAEPATIATSPAAPWTDIGGTQDGVTVSVELEFSELQIDQIVDVPGVRVTKRVTKLKTNFAEPTLAMWSQSLNEVSGTVAAATIAEGSVTFTDVGDIVTTTGAHGLTAGATVVFGTITTTTGVTAGTTYYVLTVLSTTTFTVSATLGGSILVLTGNGSSVSCLATTGSKFTPSNNMVPFTPNYVALLLDGFAPGGFRRRLIIRKALQVGSLETSYKKDSMTLLPVEFSGNFVSSTISPFSIEDATS